MKQFIIIKCGKDNHCYILDVLKLILGNNIEYFENEELLTIYYSKSDYEIIDVIKSLEVDLDCLISVYMSTYSDYLEKEYELVNELFKNSNYGQYNFKELLMLSNGSDNATEIFDFITNGSGVNYQIIEAMANCDLNVSKASSVLYMHRNTLLYKIDRLYEFKGFDLKSFKDLHILYNLIKA